MEKLKIVIILLGLIWFSGCGYIKQTNIESKDIAFSEEETTSIQSDYENYIGTWSEEGKSHESIIYEGGTEFSVEITSDNELNGYLYSQQEISGRFAEIDIICRIEDGECYYPFSDDGWGNSGILYIQFETNVIKISVQDFVMGESNTSGFGIDRTYILSKEEANQNSTESVSLYTSVLWLSNKSSFARPPINNNRIKKTDIIVVVIINITFI